MIPDFRSLLENEQLIYDDFYSFLNDFIQLDIPDFHLLTYTDASEYMISYMKSLAVFEDKTAKCAVHVIYLTKVISDLKNAVVPSDKISDVRTAMSALEDFLKIFSKLAYQYRQKKEYLASTLSNIRSIVVRSYNLSNR